MNKVLVISNMYPSEKYPHYGVFVRNTVQILEEGGYKIDVISLQKEDNSFLKIRNYLKFYLMSFFKIIKGRYDIVYAHYASHTALPILLGKHFSSSHIVTNVHGNDIVPETKKDIKYLKLAKKLLVESDLVICPSRYFQEIVTKDFLIPNFKTSVYPSGGVDSKVFHMMEKEKCLQKLRLKNKKIYIGYVGRIEEKKGWDVFIRAGYKLIKKYKNISLLVVGDGTQIGEFNKLVRNLGMENNIIRFNLLSQHEIAYVYNSVDVFVFPTYRKSESLGLVGLEAMRCGALTVLPDKYGPSSYGIDGYNCIQFISGNIESLFLAIEKGILLDEQEKEKIRINGINTAKIFDKEKNKDILIKEFSKLMEH